MQTDTRVLFQEAQHFSRLMRREVVQNDMDFLLRLAVADHVAKRRSEFVAGMPCRRFAVDFAGAHIECSIQGELTMPIILKAVPLGTSWRHRQYWIQTVQSLDGRLLVHAEYGGVLRRLQVQPDDVGSFAFKVRIVTGHIPFQAVRLQSRFVPDTLYSVFADVEVLGQLAARPVRRPVAGFLPGGAQYFRLQGRRDHGRLLPGMPHLQKPGHAPFLKTRPPACDRRRCGDQFSSIVR